MENDGIFRANGNILRPFGDVVVICSIFPCFGILCHEKSGNPGAGIVTPDHRIGTSIQSGDPEFQRCTNSTL
jgi:hypothetical protein